jgi:hypothetical protein
MPPTSRQPWDLAIWMSKRLQRLDHPHRLKADPLIAWASWHLNTAQLGWDVLEGAWGEGDENVTGHPVYTVEMAAQNLIFRGVVSAMDLCAAAIFRLTGETLRADRERDVGWWFAKGPNQPWHLVPKPLRQWLIVLKDNSTWEMATELRHAFTHRSLQRHVTLAIGQGHGAVEFETPKGHRYDAEEAMSRLVAFGRRRYSSFERAVARSYPLRSRMTS